MDLVCPCNRRNYGDTTSRTFWLRYGTPSGSIGKYVRFGLRNETGAERTTIIVDIFDILQQVRDTGIHLKVDEEQKSTRGPQKLRLACSINEFRKCSFSPQL